MIVSKTERKAGSKSVQITFRILPEELGVLEQEANAHAVKANELARRIVLGRFATSQVIQDLQAKNAASKNRIRQLEDDLNREKKKNLDLEMDLVAAEGMLDIIQRRYERRVNQRSWRQIFSGWVELVIEIFETSKN